MNARITAADGAFDGAGAGRAAQQALCETPQMILAAMAATVEAQLMPRLTDAPARAAAASLLQVIAQLGATVAWDPAPLAARLAARQALLAQPPVADAPGVPRPMPTATDAVALEQAIHACDAWAEAQVPPGAQPVPPDLDAWLLAYGRAAAEADLRFMAPTHLGRLTRKRAPAPSAAPAGPRP